MRTSRRRLYLGMLAAAAAAVPLGLPAAAQAIIGLTLHTCYGGAPGCINVAGNPLQHADAVAVSRNGSVYVTGDAGTTQDVEAGFVSHFFGGKGGAISYDGCVSDTDDGGSCTAAPSSADPLGVADSVAVSPNGRSVYVANQDGKLVHLFANARQGQLTYDGCVSADGSGGYCAPAITFGSGDPFKYATGVSVSPLSSASNGSVYFVSGLEGAVSHLFADPIQGQLHYDVCLSDDGSGGTCVDIPGSGSPLLNGNATAVNPRGTGVYVSSSDGAVSQLAASPSGGGAVTRFVGCRNDDASNGCLRGPAMGNPLDEAADVVVSPNGASVYVASPSDGTVSHFFADPTGKKLLSWDGCISDDGSGGACTTGPKRGAPLKGMDRLAISPDGKTLYSVASATDSVAWFSVASQGQLTFQGCVSDDGIPGCTKLPGQPLEDPAAVAVSPDSSTVYVASYLGGTVASFVVKTAPKPPKPHLTLTYTPKPLHAGKRTTVTFRVTSKGLPVRHATVKFADHTGLTAARGYVSFTVVLHRRTYTPSASAPGKVGTTITLHPR